MAGAQEPPSGDGERIGVYRVEGRLGEGGMGEVFLAYDERLDRRVAIKRILHAEGASDRRRERFRREARAVAQLNHPAIAQVYDVVFDDDAGDGIVMELVEGQTLRQLLAAGEPVDAMRVAMQVTEGLAAAHAKGFIHRDLKSGNVMVTADGQAKILDFGLAKRLPGESLHETLTERGALLGTVTSMSPEQALGETVDARSDLFSLGVLLYELFTGRSPFRRENPLQSLQSVIHEVPAPPRALRPELPEELSRLIGELLEKDPRRRPQSAAVVRDRLAALVGLASSTRTPSTVTPSTASAAATWIGASTHAGGAPLSITPTPSFLPPTRRRPLAAARLGSWPARIAAGILAAGFLAGAWYLFAPRLPSVLVVLAPAIGDGADARVEAVAFRVAEAAFGYLRALPGLVTIDGSEADALDAAQVAREEAADEILRTTVHCQNGPCQVSFRRLDATSNEVLGVAGPFEILTGAEDALMLANAVRAHLAQVFDDRRQGRGRPELEVSAEDYAAFVELRRRINAGEVLALGDLERLRAMIASSPAFLDAYLLATGVARTLGRLDEARRLGERARRLDAADPRPLFEVFRIELEAGELERAAAHVEELERLAPGDPRVLQARAELLATQERHEEARRLYVRLAEQHPSWRNRLALANHEMLYGDKERAREILSGLLATEPPNRWALAKLAELETLSGELERAEEVYAQLVEIAPRYLHNQGWIQLLLGSYETAEKTLRRALERDPENPLAQLNLALAIEAAGRPREAREIYRALVEKAAGDDILRAQCLVRLDRQAEALEIAEQAVESRPDDVQVLYQGAQVYALAGKRASALHFAEKALDRELPPVWFGVPSFDGLRQDREFVELMTRYAAEPGR